MTNFKQWYDNYFGRKISSDSGYIELKKFFKMLYENIYIKSRHEDNLNKFMNTGDTRYLTIYCVNKSLDNKCEPLQINGHFLDALLNSVLGIEYKSLLLYPHSKIILLPNNKIKSPDNLDVRAIFYHLDKDYNLYWACTNTVNFFLQISTNQRSIKKFLYGFRKF